MYKEVRGVTDVESGYSNGETDRPTYEQVCTGRTGHNEVVKLTYDPAQVNLRQLLEIFFVVHDPTQLNRQGNDVGTQYRSGIYYTTPEQKEVAEAMLRSIEQEKLFGRPLVTEVLPLANYSPAEEYHQDFFEKNPTQGYCLAVAAPKVAKFRKTFTELTRR
ncbi:MAG: msrA [Ramlibacter sp.]|nr:msrA [Ramlibacter sp.]